MAFARISTSDVAWHAVETVSGRYVDVSNPKVEDIELTDIAWSLSRQARFAGHTMSEEIWSVAQHALFVEHLLDTTVEVEDSQLSGSLNAWMAKRKSGEIARFPLRRLMLGALHHDDSEAYLIDLPSPVKRISALREPYKKLETAVTLVINEALSLPVLDHVEHELVIWADLMALQIEAANLMPSRGRGWTMDLPLMNMQDVYLFPKVLHWKEVYELFLERHQELSG